MSLRVLMTNAILWARSGTELHTRDLALELLRRGCRPTVYSPMLGVVADDLRADGVRVVGGLEDEREPPDVIHGHHHVETMSAMLRFPGVPAVFVCHDRTAWHDRPPRHPRIRAYVAVDENCRGRFVEDGVDSSRVQIIPNAVDLKRFRERAPLPERPRRALVFSHYAGEHSQLPVLRDACGRLGLDLDVVGNASGNACERPEELLGSYDLVFAKARCALEAMAVGCAVVLCDHLGVGPLVRAGEWDALRPLNFGRRACINPLTADHLVAEAARYDATDANEVRRRTRACASVDRMADSFLALYEAAIREQASAPIDADGEAKAAAEYLRTRWAYDVVAKLGAADAEHYRASAEAAHRGWAELHQAYDRVMRECKRLQEAAKTRRFGWLRRWAS